MTKWIIAAVVILMLALAGSYFGYRRYVDINIIDSSFPAVKNTRFAWPTGSSSSPAAVLGARYSAGDANKQRCNAEETENDCGIERPRPPSRQPKRAALIGC